MNDILDQNKEIISVGELNRSAKAILENNFSSVAVIGEISNLAQPSSGHIYFTLKDDEGSIRCAMFKNQKLRLKFNPKDGDQCILNGKVSLYAPRGDYQLIVNHMQPAGVGNLMQQFEELKQKLDAEGLFDHNRKKDIPFPPKHIGVITSESTAALQDVISTIKRRAPSSRVSLSPAMVQGDTAPESIIKALQLILAFNKKADNPIDVVVSNKLDGIGKNKEISKVENDDIILDIGPKTIYSINEVINKSNTILWNGPAGYFENPNFENGTKKISEMIADKTIKDNIFSVVGGGETVAAINKYSKIDSFTFVSTAGGAFLEFLEGKTLPGIKALNSCQN